MTHLQHVLIEPEATPMRLMPCVPPTQTGLPLPSTRLQVFTAHGNAVAAAAAATEANLCSTPSSSDGVERIFAFPEGRAPSGASVHRFDAAVVSTVAFAAALAAAPEAATARRRRRPRRKRRRRQRPGRPQRRPDPREGQPPYPAIARSDSAAYALSTSSMIAPCGLSLAFSGSSGTHLFFSLRGGSHLSASLPGSLAASDTLGSARSGFEATPVVDADHGKSESHRRRRRGRCCGGGKVQEGAGHPAGALRAADGASTRCRGARRQDQGAHRRARLDQQRSARRRTGCVAAVPPTAHDAQDSRWLQDSADSVAWAAHGMPESPHEISRPG